MRRTVIGIPDQDGIIKIQCGDDVVEIIVASIEQGSFVAEKKASPNAEPEPRKTEQPKPKIKPIPHSIRPIPMFVVPSVYEMTVDLHEGIEGTIADILRELKVQQQAPDLPDPDAILLRNKSGVDIHALVRLADRMKISAPDVMLGIAFGDDG